MKHTVKVMKLKLTVKKKRKKNVQDGIRGGLFDPPENCSDSWCETEEMEAD